MPFKCNLQRYSVAADATARFAHVLNDRRLQLGAVGGVWAGAVQVECSCPIS